MWNRFHKTQSENQELIDLSSDVLENATRNAILLVSAAAGVWAAVVTLTRSGEVPIPLVISAVLMLLLLPGLLATVEKHTLNAQWLWFAACFAVIILGLITLRVPELAFLFILIPLMAAFLTGWQAAIACAVLCPVILLLLQQGFQFTFLTDPLIWMVVFGETLFIAAAWAIADPLISSMKWAAEQYGQAWQNLEEARLQRLELNQVQEDLVLANTELSRLASQLKIMTERAEEARQIKEEFVANVSHELRTPLNMIIGYADLIVKSPKAYGKNLPSRLLVDISAIQRNSEHLIELINDVLDLSQVDTGRMALTRRWSSLSDIIDAAVAAIQPLFNSKGLYLKKVLPEEEVMVYCDSTRIREVILNLLSNAGRFTEQGGVTIWARADDHQVTVTVQDTGPGISPEDRDRIFEPFQQLDSVLHHRTGSSGLGLTISKRFVEMHDGRMWLESEPGNGAQFSFSIPLRAVSTEAAPKTGASRWFHPYQGYIPRSRPFKGPRPDPTPRFMVVEKEKTLQRLFNRYLSGVEVQSIETIDEAVAELARVPAQVLLINDPQIKPDRLDGVAIPYGTPVITCWVPGKEEAANRLGVVQYLLKPVQQEALLAALDQLGKAEMNLLLVDDDKEILHLLARIISIARPSYHVIRTNSGREALQLMRERQPDAIFLDLILPDLDGFQILKQKGDDPQIRAIPVFVITSTDPTGIPIISNRFSVQQPDGFSVREFLDCIMAIHSSLNGFPPQPDQVQQETLPA